MDYKTGLIITQLPVYGILQLFLYGCKYVVINRYFFFLDSVFLVDF